MKTDVLNKRVRVLESRAHVDLADDESEKTRLFLDRLSVAELRRLRDIAMRTNDGTLPLSVEEQSFLDSLEAKYRTD